MSPLKYPIIQPRSCFSFSSGDPKRTVGRTVLACLRIITDIVDALPDPRNGTARITDVRELTDRMSSVCMGLRTRLLRTATCAGQAPDRKLPANPLFFPIAELDAY